MASIMSVDGSATVAGSALAALFARYNPAVWPGHVIAYLLGVAALGLLVRRPGAGSSRVVAGLLAAMWLWLGVVFHGLFATDVDPVLGGLYAAMFVLQAGLFVRAGVLRDDLTFSTGRGWIGAFGWLSFGFALVGYPLVGIAAGHGYPEAPLFGMAPCPSTIATFGLLLLARAPLPRHLLVIPLAWAILGPLGAVPQGMVEDVALLVVGVAATVVVLVRDRRPRALRVLRTS